MGTEPSVDPEKLPWLKFWVTDWRGDNGLRLCSLSARGLWLEMLCLMHHAEPYGVLCVDGKAMALSELAVLVGAEQAVVEPLIAELERRRVYSKDDQGRIFSRRMKRDHHLREVRAAAGSKGGKRTAKKKHR